MSIKQIYYNQMDPHWANYPYPAPGYESATIGSGGCAPTCAAMIISSARGTVYPSTMGDIAREEGFRVSGGTRGDLFPYIADRWDLPFEQLHSSYEAFDHCQDGWFVAILCGQGLWSTGGHYILAVGTRGDQIQIFDPYLYDGKFDRYGRQGKVSVEGNSCFVQIETFKRYSNAQYFFAIKIPPEVAPEPSHIGLDEIIDLDLYWAMYEDLRNAFGTNLEALRQHFYNIGINEKRIASYVFDKDEYLNRYEDIRQHIGGNSVELYNHYINNGIKEKRTASILYDPRIYWERYEDLRNAFGDGQLNLILHFMHNGMKEFRVASVIFDPTYYRDKYKDLRDAFGNNGVLYFRHFMSNGIKENRVASKIFDVNFYRNKYDDLKKLENYDLMMHFINNGVFEARIASTEFNVRVYRESNQDLNDAFGDNWELYFIHYVAHGQFENRKCV